MNVTRDSVVALDVEVWDLWGAMLESSEAPIEYLHGGYDNIFEAVETALEGKEVGARVEVRLEPEEAFGEYDEQLVFIAERSQMPPDLEVGMQVEGLPEGVPAEDVDDDAEGGRIFLVTEMAGDTVVLDGNHPFAGMALKFVCTVRGVRQATPEEISRGYAEDPTGGVLRVLH